MLKKIGKTYDNQNCYKIDENVAVSEDGSILKIDKGNLVDTLYATSLQIVEDTTIEDIKAHVYLIEAIHIDDFIINTVDNKINSLEYIHIDYEDMSKSEIDKIHSTLSDDELTFLMKYDVVEFVKFDGNCFIIDENETSFYHITNKKSLAALEAIESAFDLEITEYEDFETLNLDLL